MNTTLRLARHVLRRLSGEQGEPTLYLDMPNGKKRPFYYRDTKADRGVIEQMFKNQDYHLRRLRRGKALHQHQEAMTSPFIVDAGANIGSSVVWFAMNYPNARIVAFEPERDNFEYLKRNTAGLNVELHHAALGAHDGKVSLTDPGEGAWGYGTAENPNGEIPLISVGRVIAENIAAGRTPFLVKIDIEGGEGPLFSENTGWIDQVPIMIVELHDWFFPGQGTSRNFLKCVAARDRDFVHIGENIFSIKN